MTEPVRYYRKKPIVIRGMTFTGEASNMRHIEEWSGGHARQHQPDIEDGGPPRLIVHTREGAVFAEVGDTILRGVAGEHYPIGKQILADTYDEVGAED